MMYLLHVSDGKHLIFHVTEFDKNQLLFSILHSKITIRLVHSRFCDITNRSVLYHTYKYYTPTDVLRYIKLIKYR